MRAGRPSGKNAAFSIATRIRGDPPAGSPGRPRRDDEPAKTARVAVVVAAFLALAAAALAGGRSVIASSPPPAPPVETSRVGEIFFTMPGGGYCRQFSFNHATAKLHEGGIARCPDGGTGGSRGSVTGFIWDAR